MRTRRRDGGDRVSSRPAEDARTLDTSDLDADQVFQAALNLIGSPNA